MEFDDSLLLFADYFIFNILFCVGYSQLAMLLQFQVDSKETYAYICILPQIPLLSRLPHNDSLYLHEVLAAQSCLTLQSQEQ